MRINKGVLWTNEFSIGTTILSLRKRKGITQEQLAGMIGVSAGAVSKWETGKSTPDIALLAPLARALDTSLNELLSFQEELLEFDKSALYLEALNQMQSTFKIGLCSGAYHLCKLYIEEGEKELAAQWFKNYIDGLISTEYVQAVEKLKTAISEE